MSVLSTRSADGTVIACERTGDGPPLVVAVGAFCTRRTFVAPPELAANFAVYTYDRRGRGDSGDTQPFAAEREYEDLAAVAAVAEAAYGSGRPFVFGHSSGGAIALRAAARGVPLAAVVAYEAPFGNAGTPAFSVADPAAHIRALVASGRRNEAVVFWMREVARLSADVVDQMEGAPWVKDLEPLAPALVYDLAVCDGGVPADELAAINVPVLILGGRNSPDWFHRSVADQASATPGARLTMIDGYDHNAPPGVITPIITEFFTESLPGKLGVPSVTESGIAITGGFVVPIEGAPIDGGTVLLRDGKILAVSQPVFEVPDGYTTVDAAGKWVLPGFIDAHAHLGVHEEAEGWAGNDTNEMTSPVTPHVRALDAINPADLGFRDAITGGVLNVNVNPGSGNPIGGQTVAVKCWGRSVDEMVLRAPAGIKSALGENPKRVYGERKETPSTRLGTAALIRGAFVEAMNYEKRLENITAEHPVVNRDLKSEALLRVLHREIPWRQHCHRADDIATAMRIASEFGYDLVIDHGTEAHLLADRIAAAGIPVVIGPLFTSRSKIELRNRSIANPGRLAAAGVEISLTTDHPVVPIHFLIHQATLAVKEGLDRDVALRAVTINPARVIGCADRLGSLEPGKDADVVIWSGDPLDVMSRAEACYQDGREIYRYDYAERTGVFTEP